MVLRIPRLKFDAVKRRQYFVANESDWQRLVSTLCFFPYLRPHRPPDQPSSREHDLSATDHNALSWRRCLPFISSIFGSL